MRAQVYLWCLVPIVPSRSSLVLTIPHAPPRRFASFDPWQWQRGGVASRSMDTFLNTDTDGPTAHVSVIGWMHGRVYGSDVERMYPSDDVCMHVQYNMPIYTRPSESMYLMTKSSTSLGLCKPDRVSTVVAPVYIGMRPYYYNTVARRSA